MGGVWQSWVRQVGLNWIWQERHALKRMTREEQDYVRAELGWAELKQLKRS